MDQQQEIKAAFVNLFTSHAGILVLRQLSEDFGQNESLFTGDPLQDAYNSGRRDAYLHILALARPSDEVEPEYETDQADLDVVEDFAVDGGSNISVSFDT